MAPSTQTRTALIVDDEASLLRLLATVFERAGYRALVAANAAEARRVFAENRAAVDLVLLDVVMPGGEGAERLLPEILAERPDVRVIVASGDEPPASLTAELDRIGGSFLRKPFLPRALLRLLDAERGAGRAPAASHTNGPGVA